MQFLGTTNDVISNLKIGTTEAISDGRFKLLIRDSFSPTSQAFSLMEIKSSDDNADINFEGAAFVRHNKAYNLTYGYANTVQLYSLAGSAGTIIGNNNFVGAAPGYSIDGSEIANGFIRFELGPGWPKSEVARFNNQGDFIVGWTHVRNYVASQSGTTVNDPVNSFFASDVGKYFMWTSTTSGGTESVADRITGYIDANNITVETTRTIASQGGRVVEPKILMRDGDLTVDALVANSFALRGDTVTGADSNGISFSWATSGNSTNLATLAINYTGTFADSVFDITDFTLGYFPKDTYVKSSTTSKIWWQTSSTNRFAIQANSTDTQLINLGSTPTRIYNDGVNDFNFRSASVQSFVPFIIGGSDGETPIAKLDVRNPNASISLYADNTRGTGTNSVIVADVTANGASNNRAIYATANGSGAVNKAIMVPNSSASGSGDFALSIETAGKNYLEGKLGVGVSDASAKLHSLSTTEQLRLGYDATNYLKFTVDSSANVTLDLVASAGIPVFTIADKFKLSGYTTTTSFTGTPVGYLQFDASGNILTAALPLGSGDVVGPASATDNAVCRFDSTTGKLIQNSIATLGDGGALNIVATSSEVSVTATNRDTANLAFIQAETGPEFGTTGIWMYATGSTNADPSHAALEAWNNLTFAIRSDSDITLYPTGASTAITTLNGNSLQVLKSDAVTPVQIGVTNSNTAGAASTSVSADTASFNVWAYGSTYTGSTNLIEIDAAGNSDFRVYSDSAFKFYPQGATSDVLYVAKSSLQHNSAEAQSEMSIFNSNTAAWTFSSVNADTANILISAYGSTHATKANDIEITASGNDAFNIYSDSPNYSLYLNGSSTSVPIFYIADNNAGIERNQASSTTLFSINSDAGGAAYVQAVSQTAQLEFYAAGSNATGINATGNSSFEISSASSIVLSPTAARFTLATTGALRLHAYTSSSSFTGTPVGYLQFDSSGNIITAAVPSGGGYTVTSVSSTPYTVTPTSGNQVFLVDASGGAITINLPTAVGNTAQYTFKKTDSSSNTVTIDANGAQTIDGDLTAVINYQYTATTMVSNNANWFLIH